MQEPLAGIMQEPLAGSMQAYRRLLDNCKPLSIWGIPLSEHTFFDSLSHRR
jgi:hypothetical protein